MTIPSLPHSAWLEVCVLLKVCMTLFFNPRRSSLLHYSTLYSLLSLDLLNLTSSSLSSLSSSHSFYFISPVFSLPWSSFSAQFLPRSPAFHWPTRLGHQQIASWTCPFSLAFGSENRNFACYNLSFKPLSTVQLIAGIRSFFSTVDDDILRSQVHSPCSTLHCADLEIP